MRLVRGYALAPKSLVSNKQPVLFMYRENPDNCQDSGWRFFSGTESDEYVNNPDNIGMYDMATITNFCSDVIPYLNSPYGSMYERQDSQKCFEKINV